MDEHDLSSQQEIQVETSPTVEPSIGVDIKRDRQVREDSDPLTLKTLEIEDACNLRTDHRPLFHLAVSKFGLVSDELRRKACMSTRSVV